VFVSFSTEREHEVLLEVVDMNGQVVRTIAENRFPEGKYRLVWDGKDDLGFEVKTGNYLVCLYLDGRLAGCEKIMKSAR
jgi:flagellar hook assembly protein FlgD